MAGDLSPRERWAVAVWMVLLVAGGIAQAAELQEKAGGALSLQVAFDKEAKAAFGPAPMRQSPTEAVWKAGDILNNAQGAVSFRIRIPAMAAERPGLRPHAERRDERAFVLMSLSGTQAGEWTLSVNEAPEPKGKAKPSEQAAEPDEAMKLDEKEKREALGAFTCEVRTRIFAEGNIAGKTSAAAKIFEWGQWHHVVWTWRSVHHFIFIDGKLRGTSLQVSRMQPMASAEAIFRVLLGKAELSDLRLYKRALDPPDAAALSTARPDQHLPPFPPLRLWADWGPGTGRSVVYADIGGLPAVRVNIMAQNPSVRREQNIVNLPSGLGETVISFTKFSQAMPQGTYRFEGAAFDKDGKELARGRSADWTCPEKMPLWLWCRAGLSYDTELPIPPPYTPVDAKGECLRVLLREHALDRTGLYKSIVSAGEELLASPMRLDITVGGKPLAFPGGLGLRTNRRVGDNREWGARCRTPEGHELLVVGFIECDGIARWHLELRPRGTLDVDGAELIIPFRPEVMQHFHCVASGFINRFMAVEKDKEGRFRARNICWDIYSPKEPKRREGVIYDANDVHHMADVDRFRFVPFVHVGNNQRGLAWFAENDQGWVHDPGKVPPMEIVATEKERLLRLNIVAKPTTITEKEPLSFRFFLLANPFKPMPKDWRSWVVGDYRKDTEFARKAPHRFWWHWNEYAKSFVPYPGGVQGKTYQDWVGKFKGDDLIHCPFINFGVPADSGLYGPPFFDEMAVLPYSWKLHNSRPHQDYVAYWLDKCAKEIGIKGVYVDEPYCEPYSYNVLASDAPYIRPDGTRAVGYRWLEARDYFRRIKQTFHDLGLPHSLWVHTTNYKVSPALTFVDISMDGEHPMIWVPSFQDCHVFYNAERSRGYISGIPFGWVGTQMFHGNTEPKAFPGLWVKSRTYLAVTLPNQVLPQTCGIPDELDRIHNLWSWFGIGEEGVEEWPGQDAGQGRQDAGQGRPAYQFAGVANRKKGQALLYATAPWKGSRIELPDGLKKAFDPRTPHIHAWNAETGASLVVDEKTLVDLAMPNDVAVIFARGADKPQASRPEGVLLGVSFHNGLEPDYGSEMLPATGASAVSARALAVGFDKPAVGYSIVPSWVQGRVEFDLSLKSLSRTPLRLLALQHHLDLTLSAVQKGEEKGLLLVANEVVPQENLAYQSGRLPTVKREAFAPIPVGETGRVTLVWRSGQYDLYWKGKRLGGISAPAAPGLRDAAAPAFGLRLGDG
ncbi:MAG: LamG domain-containing protein, partial [Planctomycetes bacterium]|nr:LamG domain-containing protein [Planctomycetota bacterium]